MAGEFLPPVVTTLDGNIKPLLAELAKAEAAIKKLGDQKFEINLTPVLNKQAMGRAMGEAKTEASKGVEFPLRPAPDFSAFVSAMQAMQAYASANPIHVPVEPDGTGAWRTVIYRGLGIGTGSRGYGALPSAERLAITSGGRQFPTPPSGGDNVFAMGTNRGWTPYAQPGGRVPLAIEGPSGPTVIQGGVDSSFTPWRIDPFGRYRLNALSFGPGNPNAKPIAGRQDPGWGAWWAGGLWNSFMGRNGAWPYAATHLGLTGIGALLAGTMGLGLGAGALGAVYGSSASAAYSNASGIYTSMLSTIPVGVPDYGLARVFGLNNAGPNSPLAQASRAGQGTVYSALGNILAIANKGGGLSSVMAKTGTSLGNALNTYLANKAIQPGVSTSTWSRLFSSTTGDAKNILSGFGNIGRMFAFAAGSMPGEIEWLTQGFKDLTGAGAWATKAPVLGGHNGILHDVIFGTLLAHLGGIVGKLLGGGLGDAGWLSKIPGIGGLISKIPGMGLFGDATLGTNIFGGTFGASMLNPVALAATATIGSGLWLYRYQSRSSAADKALMGNIFGANYGTALANVGYAQGLFANQARTGNNGISFLGHVLGAKQWQMWQGGDRSPLAALGWAMNYLVPGGLTKWTSQSNQGAVDLYAAQQAFVGGPNSMGGIVNSVASAFGLSTFNAAQYLAAAGVPQGASPALARRMVRSFLNASGILNPNANSGPLQGFNAANMGVNRLVGDSAWKAAGQVNSNWDSFMNALTSGGTGLGNLAQVMAHSSPSVAKNLGAGMGSFINTSQGVQSAGQPLMDFLRLAQASGGMGLNSMQQSMLQLAASMGPLAGHSKAAQAELLAMANQSGLDVKSFGDLMKMEGGAGNASKNFARSIQTATIAMAKMPYAQQQISQSILVGTNGAIAAAIEKSKGLYNSYNNLTTVLSKVPSSSQRAATAAGVLAGGLAKAGVPTQEIVTYLHELHINLDLIPNNIKKELHIQTNARQAANDFAAAARAWANVPSGQWKTDNLFLNTNAGNQGSWVTNATGKHHALGVRSSVTSHWAWVGERGPELMYVPSGSSVIPTNRTGQTMAEMGSAMGGGDIHNHIYIDGKELFNAIKSRTYDYNTQNGNRTRGGRMAGTLRPRP